MRGLGKELAKVLPGDPDVTVTRSHGAQRVQVVWPDGAKFKLDVYKDRVEWKDLTAADRDEPTGLYTKLAEVTPPFFKKGGVSHYLMCPGSEQARERLLARGDWKEYDYEVGGQVVHGYRWDL